MTTTDPTTHETITDLVRAAVRHPRFDDIRTGDPVDQLDHLIALARHGSVSVARLVEAHLDAVVILGEAGLDPRPGALYGVWASRGEVERHGGRISGPKPFCSGLGVVDRALVSGSDAAGGPQLLLDVAVDDQRPGVEHDHGPWTTEALADTATGTCRFADHPVDAEVGPPGWYLSRPGFWAGALRPAACWAGAALGLVDRAVAMGTDAGPHRLAHGGAHRPASAGSEPAWCRNRQRAPPRHLPSAALAGFRGRLAWRRPHRRDPPVLGRSPANWHRNFR